MEKRVLFDSNINMKFYCELIEDMIAETNISEKWLHFRSENPSHFMITYLNEGCKKSMVFTRSKIVVQMDIDNDVIVIYSCYDTMIDESLLVLRKADEYNSQFNNRTVEEFTLNMSPNFFQNNFMVLVTSDDECMKIGHCNAEKSISQIENPEISSDFEDRRIFYIGSGIGIVCIFIIIKVWNSLKHPNMKQSYEPFQPKCI
ncbi:unnamed protein product [Diamesa hyperborea]